MGQLITVYGKLLTPKYEVAVLDKANEIICGALQKIEQLVKNHGLESEKVFVVISVENYVPHVQLVTLNKEKALEVAQTNWPHERKADSGEIYFNQEEDGNMEQAVSVQEHSLSE
jgi:hypothetical protein